MVRDMAAHQASGNEEIWRCLHCRGPLTSGGLGLRCAGCGRQYPVVAGIPLLVREPRDYFRAERASLVQAAGEARQRKDLLDRAEPYSGLPEAALERHRDVLDVEAAQAETLLALLEPSVPALEALADHAGESQVVRPGWRFDTLAPYLLRDWTDTSELQVTNSRIAAALEQAFPDPRGKSVAFAGCGAGGLLAEVSADFARVLGFDLTLPILAAARQILDGKTLDLALPRVLNERGCISLGRRDPRSTKAPVELLAMDALDTAFADGSIDCVVTVFLTDILADPRALADEVHRVLPDNGVWINYGPSGNNLKALWRFDQTEAAAFFKTAGFAVVQAEARRGTNLDISSVCPSVSFFNPVCYMTVARKTGEGEARPTAATPGPDEVSEIIPQHFPGAHLVQRLAAEENSGFLLQHDRIPGRPENWKVGGRAARMMVLIDGKKTVGEIADLLSRREPPQSVDETLRAFARFFNQGLLNWRGRDP
jgi:SAM-dependent methyltransferase